MPSARFGTTVRRDVVSLSVWAPEQHEAAAELYF